MTAILLLLLFYGTLLTPVFGQGATTFSQVFIYSFVYLLIWTLAYYLVLRKGNSILGNTLKMVAIWLAFAFIVPGAVHQSVSISNPAKPMTDFIDTRDLESELFDLPDSVFRGKVYAIYPALKQSLSAKDSTKINFATRRSAAALINEVVKNSTAPIEIESQNKNAAISNSFWFNPLPFFQNRLNRVCETHYSDYLLYRREVQSLIDLQIRTMLFDIWNDVEIDKDRFQEYQEELVKL